MTNRESKEVQRQQFYQLTMIRCISSLKLEHTHNGLQALDFGNRLLKLLFIVIFELEQFLEQQKHIKHEV